MSSSPIKYPMTNAARNRFMLSCKIPSIRCGLFLIGLLFISVFMIGRLVSNLLVNIAEVGYVHAMVGSGHDALTAESTPRFPIKRSNFVSGSLFQIKEFNTSAYAYPLQIALALNPTGFHANWLRGRTELISGDAAAASRSLERYENHAPINQYFYMDLFAAYAQAGRWSDLIGLWEEVSFLPRSTVFFSDTLALAYLNLLNPRIPDIGQVRAAAALRPNDAFLQYLQWKNALDNEREKEATVFLDDLRRSSFEAIEPANPHLISFIGNTVPLLYRDGIWSQEKIVSLLTYYIWVSKHPEHAVVVLEQLYEQYANDADWPYYLGEYYRRQGNFALAAEAYRTALSLDDTVSLAALRHAQVLLASCVEVTPVCMGQILQAYDRFKMASPGDVVDQAEFLLDLESRVGHSALQPQLEDLWHAWSEKTAALGPAIPLAQIFEGNWLLEGYSLQEQRLARGEPGAVILFWRSSENSDPGQSDPYWRRVTDNRWLQIVPKTQNLVVNGGFELGFYNKMPVGFPSDIYRAPAETHELEFSFHQGYESTVAVLSNSLTYTRTSYATEYLPVKADLLYLQSGWMISEGGNGFMGRRWRAESEDISILYSNIIAGNKNPDWRRYAQVIFAPLANATDVQIRLQNFNAEGSLRFDDVLLVPLSLPPTLRQEQS